MQSRYRVNKSWFQCTATGTVGIRVIDAQSVIEHQHKESDNVRSGSLSKG